MCLPYAARWSDAYQSENILRADAPTPSALSARDGTAAEAEVDPVEHAAQPAGRAAVARLAHDDDRRAELEGERGAVDRGELDRAADLHLVCHGFTCGSGWMTG